MTEKRLFQQPVKGRPLRSFFCSGLAGIFIKELNAKERALILLNTIAYQAKIEIDRCLISKPQYA